MHEAFELLDENGSLRFFENEWRVNVGVCFAESVVLAVLLHPFLRKALDCGATHRKEDGSHPRMGFEARVSPDSVIANSDAKPGNEPHSKKPGEVFAMEGVHLPEERNKGGGE